MTTTTFDTLGYKDLATKGDIHDVRQEIQEVRREIQEVRQEIQAAKFEILKWMIGILIGQTALIVALMAYLK